MVVDQVTGKPVNKASTILVRSRNGKLIGYARTNGLGHSSLVSADLDSLKLIVNHSKYVPLILKDYRCKDTVFLYPLNRVIKEVIIKGTRAVTLNGDTVSYIADSFKVPPGSNVEDLLKRLPGIQVAKDGTIKANGTKVERVLVDGDDFFGNDATIATRNIEASMIDRVEVIDVESQRTQATGETEDQKVKIINLKLKNDAKKGFFGKTKQGYSNTNRFESTNMLNVFRDKLKISAYALGDNLNTRLDWQDRQDMGLSQNWYYDEDLDEWTNSEGDLEGGNTFGVIPRNIKTGAMISQQFEDGTGAVNAKYNYNNQKFDGDQSNSNTLIFDQGKRSTQTSNRVNSETQKSNIGLSIEKRIDTLNKIFVTAKVATQKSDGENIANQLISLDSNLTNSSLRQNTYNSRVENYQAKIDFSHKFKKKGRFGGLSGDLSFNRNDNSGKNIMTGKLFDLAGSSALQSIDQSRSNYNKSSTIKLSSIYLEPLVKESLVLEGAASLLINQHKSFNNTFDKNVLTSEYTDLISSLSNNYTYNVLALSQQLKLRYKSKKIEMSVGAKLQETNLSQTNLDSTKLNLRRGFVYALPNTKFMWKYKRNSNLSLNFTTTITPPSLQEIQPFVNNFNPQFIVKGNPNLIPSYNYRFSLQNTFWYPVSQSNLWSNVSLRLTENDIVPSTDIDEKGNVTQTYVQVNGNYVLNGNLYYSFQIPSLQLNVNPGLNFSHTKSSQFNNGVNNQSMRNDGGFSMSFSKTIDSLLTSDLSFNLDYTKTNVSNSSFNNNELFTYRVSTEHKLSLPWKFKLTGELNWRYMPVGNSFNQDQSFVLLNAGLERSFMKDNSIILALNFYDILNQNRTVTRYFTNNQIYESIQQALTRYGMLSLTYKFKNKAKSQENENGF